VTASKVANEMLFVLKNTKSAEISYGEDNFGRRTSKVHVS
jgi:hypothetical protein